MEVIDYRYEIMIKIYSRESFFKISYISIFALLVLVSCLDNIQILNSTFRFFHYFYIIRYTLICYLILSYILKRKRFSLITFLILLILTLIILVTIRRSGDYLTAIQVISRPFLIVMVLDYYRNKVDCVLSTWMKICFILVFIDLMSMILFPTGLYATNLYDINWFLGYKTARFEYVMPLVLISLYLSYKSKNNISLYLLLTLFMSLFTMWYSKSTAAFLSLLFLIIIVILDFFKGHLKQKFYLYYLIFANKIIILLYTFANIALFLISQLIIVQQFVINVLHKDPTLTTRTTLWARIFQYMRKFFMFGCGYLNFDQFVLITQNQYAGSAHNLMIRILVNVGFVGLILFYVILLISLPNKKNLKSIDHKYFVFVIGIVATLIIGLTSDSMFLSFFNFSIIQLAYFNKKSIKSEKGVCKYE